MVINGVAIDDTFAEAFGMRATRLIITADTDAWARIAAESLTGFATSVIACGCEAGIERDLAPEESPDGRPGVAVLMFATSSKELQKQLQNRVGQCVLTSAGSACFAGMDAPERLKLGGVLRYFGDGFQISKKFGDRRYWRIPVMDGEFVCDDEVGMVKGVGGGNILILAASRSAALDAAERAVVAMRAVPNVILPVPGGIVRSGSKVGSKYKALIASTNDAYCPTLKGQTKSALRPEVESVLEIVIDGLRADDVAAAMRAGILAACENGAAGGVLRITAGNYGGKLGQFHFKLHEIVK
jgi:formylmethanofuran--tetrahydromethanopterin N-formyltransferase